MKRAILLLSCFMFMSTVAEAHDWAHWRGPEQNGVSREKDLPEKWSLTGENLIWKAPYGGRSTPIVMGDRVYIINSVGQGVNEQERVMCLDANTGKLIWEHKFNVFYTDIVSVRLGWTNLAGDPETGNVYAHGTQGLFFCFDRDGKILWQRSLTEEYGRISGYGGRVTSPFIADDLVIIGMLNASWGSQGMGGNRFVAFDKKTGEVKWWTATKVRPRNTYNSTPAVAIINGEKVFITGGAAGDINAFRTRNGEPVWSYQFGMGAVNVSPVVDGSLVYMSHGEESPDTNEQGRIICLDASQIEDGKPKMVWKKDGIIAKFASPVVHDGRVYICDETAKMYCFDAKTGKELWKKPFTYGRNCKGSPVLADGKIYVAEVNARFHILKPEDDGCKRLHQQFFRSKDPLAAIEINGSPAVANGRIYFNTSEEMYCLGKKEVAKADPLPKEPEESKADANAKPAVLQIVPGDIVLDPGESATFKARVFDDKGHFLKEVEAKYSLEPMGLPPGIKANPPPLKGKMEGNKLTVDKMPPGQFGRVKGEAEGLTAYARVRVAPTLPIKADFSKVPVNAFPGGWVNTQGKYAITKLDDGTQVLKKTAVIASPLVARSNAQISRPTYGDYTVQADVMGKKVREDLPDMGVNNCRYTFFLNGNQQKLRLVSWDAQRRVDETIDWKWQPDKWYTLKLKVTPQKDKALVQGKVWEKGQPEPDKWTIEFTDPTPNLVGSPG
ncbi:MAG: PQQ-binding-like beta-propeller repeat protein, partial [Gemmataceae bacterium]